MQRFPDGIEGREIQQKQAPAYFPEVGRAFEDHARFRAHPGENGSSAGYVAEIARG
jgi:hypothetical protein